MIVRKCISGQKSYIKQRLIEQKNGGNRLGKNGKVHRTDSIELKIDRLNESIFSVRTLEEDED